MRFYCQVEHRPYDGRADAMHEFLPCTYGYATTIRRAQGASLDYVCLFFDAKFPPDRGYGYVGASRCRTAAGLYYFKRLRRTDWLPIGDGDSDEQEERGSASDADSVDPYDGWCGDQSDCSSLRSRSEGYLSSDGYVVSEHTECDSNGDPLPPSDGYVSEHTEYDEDGDPIIEDPPIVGDGDFTIEGPHESFDAYEELFEGEHALKRRRMAE